ncbi:hypothetical protein BDD12DRAFT_805984 [Trichophaea hybrida]|nr:hypothetical protein BDD12DRAFT_805984 [Trichophaea hybrida]
MPRTRANCKRKADPSSKSTSSNKRIKNSGKIDTHSNLELHSHIANESLCAPGPNCPSYFQHFKPDAERIQPYCGVSDKEVNLVIDSHFYDFTPLNTPEGEIMADVIAVTGLAGHAFGSWRNRESCKMWLQDFLPHDIKKIRIMTYGYDTNLSRSGIGDRMSDYVKHMIQQLEIVRGSSEGRNRPIIFLGHSLGGILILQSKIIALRRHILDSTRAIFFFGTPHQGLRTAELEAMVEDISSSQSSKLSLLFQLRENSEFLETNRDGLVDIWNGRKIVNFYETLDTPTVKKSVMGDYRREGDAVKMVKKISAQLFLPNEDRIPVRRNHTDMVKYIARTDSIYQTVVHHIRDCLREIEKEKKTRSNICTTDVNECLKSLRTFDVESYRDEIFLKRHEDTCTWIFSDKTYKGWVETGGVLWVHGGPGCSKSVLSSFLSKNPSGDENSSFGNVFPVAYFFCDDKDERLRTADAIMANLLAQFLIQMPNAFVHFFAERQYAMNKEKTSWNLGMLWRVFDRIVKNDNYGPLYLIIDALDECEEESREKFLVRLKHLWKDLCIETHVRVIITSRPHIPIASYLPNVIQISLNASILNRDITEFVTTEVPKLPCVSADSNLAKEVQQVLINGSDGMFLWVSLILDDLKNSTTTKRRVIREKIKALPKSLPEVYKNILRRIKVEDRRAAKTILQWIVCAIRPLTLQELTIAIAVRPGDTSIFSIRDEMETNIQSALQSLFGPLLRIEAGDNTVHLIHQSHVRETDQENLDLWHSFWRLAQFTPRMELAHQIFYISRWPWKNFGGEATALEIAASSGFSCFVKRLLDNGADVNAESDEYGSALQEAADKGHKEIVELLLGGGADINIGTYNGRSSAVVLAAVKDHEAIVELLVDGGAGIDSINPYAEVMKAHSRHNSLVRGSVQNGPGRAGPDILRPGPKALYKARPAALSAGFSGLSLAGL